MKKIIFLMVIVLTVAVVNGCKPKKASNNQSTNETTQMDQNDGRYVALYIVGRWT